MSAKLLTHRLFFVGLICLVFMAGCKSADPLFERSRPEYEYVPPVKFSTPEPVAVRSTEEPLDAVSPQKITRETTEETTGNTEIFVDEEGTVAEAPAEKKSSLFGRIFSRNKSDKANQPVISRVGDTPVIALDEEGNPLENNNIPDKVYRLKIGDAVFINLSGSGGLNDQIETLIDAEGFIKLRFIGSVKANGLSSTELEREIVSEYTVRQKIYKDVTVRVTVPNTFYFIGGEIRQPGRFPLVGRVTLSQAVVSAGNFTEWAKETEIILVRNNERVVIDFKRIRQDPTLDVELLAGDVINVSRSTF